MKRYCTLKDTKYIMNLKCIYEHINVYACFLGKNIYRKDEARPRHISSPPTLFYRDSFCKLMSV